jgi:hypothetical protein
MMAPRDECRLARMDNSSTAIDATLQQLSNVDRDPTICMDR